MGQVPFPNINDLFYILQVKIKKEIAQL